MKTQWGVEIILENPPTETKAERATGFGDKAHCITHKGARPIEVYFVRDGKPEISLKLGEDGRIHLTTHGNSYQMHLDQSQTFYPVRPWPKP